MEDKDVIVYLTKKIIELENRLNEEKGITEIWIHKCQELESIYEGEAQK